MHFIHFYFKCQELLIDFFNNTLNYFHIQYFKKINMGFVLKEKSETTKEKSGGFGDFFSNFFSGYALGGLIVLLVTIILNLLFPQTNFFVLMVIKLFETLAIAVIVASVFTYSIETPTFLNMIKKKLEDVVISKKFLGDISSSSKQEAIKYMLRPSELQLNKYSNIESYYDHYIQETLNVTYKNVRSQYRATITVKYDLSEKKIYADWIVAYRLFPSETGYTPLEVGFLKRDSCSRIKEITILPPNSKRKKLDLDALENHKIDREDAYVYQLDINKLADNKNHVDIEIKIKECGHDHWMAINFKALQPTDGFSFDLHCNDDITIKEKMVFNPAYTFDIDDSDERDKHLHVACTQWMNEGSGIVAVVSRPQEN